MGTIIHSLRSKTGCWISQFPVHKSHTGSDYEMGRRYRYTLCIGSYGYFLGRERTPETTLLTLHNNEASTTLVTTLEDGSIVYLADNSQLSYPEHFQREKREVSLLGNALFDVSGNKERPFLIETEQARIEVLGTSFNIKKLG